LMLCSDTIGSELTRDFQRDATRSAPDIDGGRVNIAQFFTLFARCNPIQSLYR
jgi:hypothetical protein